MYIFIISRSDIFKMRNFSDRRWRQDENTFYVK